MNPLLRRPLAGLLAAALLGAAMITIAAPASAAPVPPKIWERRLDGAAIKESSPLLVDLDGSGGLDVIVGAYDKKVHAVRGTDAGNLPGWPQTTSHRINSSPAVADVNGDGGLEVFVGSGMGEDRQGALYSYAAGGALRFRSAPADPPHFPNGAPIHGSPVIGDLDGDGDFDVTVGSQGVRSLWTHESSNGSARSLFYWDDSMFSSGAMHDVNGDGVTEIIIGGDSTPGAPIDHRGGMVRAFNGAGRQHWEFLTNDIVRSSPAVGDIDGDGRPEVVFGVGDFYGGSDARHVFAVDAGNGALKWRRQVDGVTNSSPALADINGDGRLDVAIGTFNSARLGLDGGSVYALDGRNGSDLSGFPKPSGGGVVLGGIVTADVDGDGGQDLFVPTGAYIAVFSGKTGAKLFNLAEGAGVAFQNSVAIADVDRNGKIDVVAAGTNTAGHGYLYRWELPAPARLGSLGWHQFHKDTFRSGSWTVDAPTSPILPSRRISGTDRYDTAAALSSAAMAGGTVYVATGLGFGDALAGGPAAASEDAPVLLVRRDDIPQPTANRITALRPRRIVVLGGTVAVSEAVFDQLDAMATEGAERIAGADKWDTAAAISRETFLPGVEVAYVATGDSAYDALAGAATAARRGAPILLVQRDAIPMATAVELRRLAPRSIVVLGSTGVVSSGVENQLRTYSTSVTRIGAGDRYATAVEISKATYPSGTSTAYVATGLDFPDALAGGPVAASDNAPMLLVPGRCLPLSVRRELLRLGVDQVVLLGAESIVSRAVTSYDPCP